jgi:hypothetical protein
MSMPICTTVQLYILLLGNEFVVQTYISTVSQKLKQIKAVIIICQISTME